MSKRDEIMSIHMRGEIVSMQWEVVIHATGDHGYAPLMRS